MTTLAWDPERLKAARERGRLKALAAQRARPNLVDAATGHRGDRLAIALTMFTDGFRLHEIKRVTGLAPSVVSERAAWAGLSNRPRGLKSAAAKASLPTVARVLDELDGPRGTPLLVAKRLGVSLASVVAIGTRRPEPPVAEPAEPERRCPACHGHHRGASCPFCSGRERGPEHG